MSDEQRGPSPKGMGLNSKDMRVGAEGEPVEDKHLEQDAEAADPKKIEAKRLANRAQYLIEECKRREEVWQQERQTLEPRVTQMGRSAPEDQVRRLELVREQITNNRELASQFTTLKSLFEHGATTDPGRGTSYGDTMENLFAQYSREP